MPLTAERKQSIIAESRRSESDTGSPEVQISLLTQRISELTEHVRDHKLDNHSRRGLVMMVSRRNRLLKYLSRTNRDSYQSTIKRLGLRK